MYCQFFIGFGIASLARIEHLRRGRRRTQHVVDISTTRLYTSTCVGSEQYEEDGQVLSKALR